MKEEDPREPGALSTTGSANDRPARRTALILVWTLVLGVLAVMVRGVASFLSASGPKEKTRYSVPIPERFPFKGAEFWLDRDEKGLFAFLDRCPHLGCKPVYHLQNEEYVCPCHGSRFSRGGVFVSGPARKSMQRVLVRRKPDNGLVIELREKAPDAYRLPL